MQAAVSASAMDFERTFGQHRERVRSFILGRVRNHEVAEDLTQDTLVIAHRDQHRLQTPEKAWSFLIGIAKNRILGRNRDFFKAELTVLDDPGSGSDGTVREVADCRFDPCRMLLEEAENAHSVWSDLLQNAMVVLTGEERDLLERAHAMGESATTLAEERRTTKERIYGLMSKLRERVRLAAENIRQGKEVVSPQQEKGAQREKQWKAVEPLLPRFPAERQRILRAIFQEGLTKPEAAQALGRPLAEVHSTVTLLHFYRRRSEQPVSPAKQRQQAEKDTLRTERWKTVEPLLPLLPPDRQEVARVVFHEGLSISKAAKALNRKQAEVQAVVTMVHHYRHRAERRQADPSDQGGKPSTISMLPAENPAGIETEITVKRCDIAQTEGMGEETLPALEEEESALEDKRREPLLPLWFSVPAATVTVYASSPPQQASSQKPRPKKPQTTVMALSEAPAGWKTDPAFAWVGSGASWAPSTFANPFGERGRQQYGEYMQTRLQVDPIFRQKVQALKGKTLVSYDAASAKVLAGFVDRLIEAQAVCVEMPPQQRLEQIAASADHCLPFGPEEGPAEAGRGGAYCGR